MSSSNFAERFRDKASTMSYSGALAINPNLAVSKPSDTQLHSNILKSSANNILKKSISPQPDNFSTYHVSNPSIKLSQNDHQHAQSSILPATSDSPKLVKRKLIPITPTLASNVFKHKVDLKEVNKSYERPEYKNFTPYTLNDYHSIKPKTYYQLGGLGPNVGSDEWLQKRNLNEKRINYGLNVYLINAAKLPFLPVHVRKSVEKEENSRERALKFAQNIPKPILKKPDGN